MKKQLAVVAGVILVSSSIVFAMGECDKYKTPYDKTYCMSKLFVESDKELNSVYKELRGVLKPSVKQKLTETQREWISYRDNACQDQPGTINVDCNYKVNKERTEYLRDRLRECKTGNTRPDMIAKKSWQ
jgi:uncharacterized protein YecT (DUF1311 family)